jgi:drug/metabolite transporter (DMT)-like permease
LVPIAGLGLMMHDKPFSFGNDDFIGMAAMLASAIIYAYTMILYKKESANYSKFEIVFFQNVVGGLLFIPAGVWGWANLTTAQISGAIIFGILLGIIAFGLFFSALRQIKASTASFLSYLEVVVTVLLGIWLYGDPFTWQMAIGGTMIVVSTYFLRQ